MFNLSEIINGLKGLQEKLEAHNKKKLLVETTVRLVCVCMTLPKGKEYIENGEFSQVIDESISCAKDLIERAEKAL